MAKTDSKKIDIEELNLKANQLEKTHITSVETFIFLFLTGLTDLGEFLAALTAGTIIGIPILILVFIFGVFVSGICVLWLMLRGGGSTHTFIIRRLLIFLAGAILDAATAGALPMRSIAMAVAIYVNNHFATKDLDKIFKILERVV